MLLAILRLFPFVRNLERDYREVCTARIKAETLAAEYASQRDELKDELQQERASSNKRLENIAEILSRRFLGSSLNDIEPPPPEIDQMTAIKPKIKSFGVVEREARTRLAADLRDFLNDEPTD